MQITNYNLKIVLGTIVFIAFIFVFGIKVENKIISDFNRVNLEKKVEVVIDPPSSINSGEAKEIAIVKRVIDGDTIELSDGRKVRYIGVNSPEMTDKRAAVLKLAQLAKAENIKLTEGKTVEMEKDVSETDKYGRLLRYVYVDNEMINLKMVQLGMAAVATYPPDIKHKEFFVDAAKTQNKN